MNDPGHPTSTHRMLVSAFPDGVAGDEYFAVIALLYDHMSDRSLAESMELAFRESGADRWVVYNDIAKVASGAVVVPPAMMAAARERLNAAGYENWTREDELP